jgi:hypothetical protein
MIDGDDCGAVGGMTGRGHRSVMRKSAHVPLCPPQIPYDDRDSNPGRRSGKPASNSLSSDKAEVLVYGEAVLDFKGRDSLAASPL